MRLNRSAEARSVLGPIHGGLQVVENQAYLRLLLLFRGELAEEALTASAAGELDPATLGYGLGNWHFLNGRRAAAVRRWQAVVGTGPWAAFGAIAAEADLQRMEGYNK